MLIFFFISDFYEVTINKLPINFEVGWSLCPPWYTVVADAREGSATCYCTPTSVIYVVCSLSPTLPPNKLSKSWNLVYVGTEEGFLSWDCGGDTNGANQQITDERWSQWAAGVPEPTSLSCKVAVHTYLACSESWVRTRMVGGSCLAQVHHNPGLCLPSTADPLPGQAWKEVTFSKVCLNRNDMWMCWHETPLSALYHRISCSCQKSSRGCFLSPSFLFSFSSPSLWNAARCQRKQNQCLF